ncbi:hypothetical protein BFP76_13950 [Amylibacter kogurei]|uniref:TRAP C4-dicarboxylate transport system permease DctM subunit domain-containing protein n=1 Tax=Paramylibacter kogurei TaxID=1889778 RepID=A0A2G5KB06_9RHOB|nr:TRAP transporter fused permease subunit [Amylibacter kogurei]PIB26060.1 hypothetical protein BFP76_13950 [Amylibacter kogurei]
MNITMATNAMYQLSKCVAAVLTVFAIYVAGFGVFDTVIVYGTTAVLGMATALLNLAATGHAQASSADKNLPHNNIINILIHLLMLALFIAITARWIVIMAAQEDSFVFIGNIDMALAWLAFGLIGYVTYRFFGTPMVVVYGAVLLYALAPDWMGGAGRDWVSIADRMWFSTDGVYGGPLQVVSSVVLVFIVFGAILQASGAGETLLKIAFAGTGRFAGGPAHAAIVGSALFGTMSGAAVANVVSTGVFTIPIIKRAGFKPKFAGAVEAAASTGGQIMPPVMGVVAFIMAKVTNISYLQIVLAAILPAVFYYISLFMVVLVEARKQGIGATPIELREKLERMDWVKSIAFWVPLMVIIGVLTTGRTAQNAGFYAMLVALILCLVLFKQFRNPAAWWDAMVRAGMTSASLIVIVISVGLVIGIVNMTGIGLAFADAIRAASGGSLFFALILVMLGCLVMGMGVPSVTAYLILALVMGPVLEQLGLPKIAAHMFMLYFGVLSVVTPPVALAAFAAAPIAGARPMETGFTAVRLAIAGFVIPFLFVYRPEILLIENDFSSTDQYFTLIYATVGFLIGTWLIATALARFERAHLAHWETVLRIIAAILIFWVNPLMNIAGIILAMGVFVYHYSQSAKQDSKIS